jgi:membrane fusion protein (multidrug efflux system)
MKKLLLLVVLIASAAAGYYYFSKHFAGTAGGPGGMPGMGAMGPVPVGTVTVAAQPVSITRELPGRVNAYRTAEIRPQVNGIILKRLFEEGSDVKKGQQLYQIDPAPYQAAFNSARADLQKAEANVGAVKARLGRYEELVKISAVSKQDYDDAVAQLNQNEAAVAIAKAAVDTARINLNYTKVTSPIDGRIGKSLVTEGALVTANQQAPIALVQQLDPIYVDVTQSSAELLRLRSEMTGANANADAPVTVFMEGNKEPYAHQGKLQFSDITVDEGTGAVELRALIPNPDHVLLPGLFVRARIEQATHEDAILVPQRAVSRNPDGSASVWVVGEDNKVNPRVIEVADASGDSWIVTNGLENGDRVVVEGTQKIRPGADVKPLPAGDAPADGQNAQAPQQH